MKKIKLLTFLGIISFLFSATVYADGTSGCGFGTKIWKGKKGMIPHISAASTNSTYTKYLGVTSGTAGCNPDSVVKKNKQTETFIAANEENLFENMSQGQGEYLATYAKLLECSDKDYSEFKTILQENLDSLITAQDAQQIIKQTKKVLLDSSESNHISCNLL